MLICEKSFELQEPSKLKISRLQDQKICKITPDFTGTPYYILQPMCCAILLWPKLDKDHELLLD